MKNIKLFENFLNESTEKKALNKKQNFIDENVNELFGRSKPNPLDNETSEAVNKVINDMNEDLVGLMKGVKLFKFLEDKTKLLVLEDVYKRMTKPSFDNEERKIYDKHKKFIIENLLWIHK